MVFVVLDLYKRYITAWVLDAAGAIVAEARRVDATWDYLSERPALLAGPLIVVLETTVYCWWLERKLAGLGDTVVVVHPYQVKVTWQSRTKTDAIDARKLAELARAQLLPAVPLPRAVRTFVDLLLTHIE